MTHNASSKLDKIGITNPFSHYLKFIPLDIPLPTFWTAAERALLVGTTLETAIEAKAKSLDREFKMLQKATASISWCGRHWWNVDTGHLSIDDWTRMDAIYRSRSLDMLGAGHAIVPCIDMANHASRDDTTASYDVDPDGNAILVLRHGKSCESGEEIAITYGETKSACEMLFSYGFIEASMPNAQGLYLDLEIPDDDPLKIPKMAVFNASPGFRIFTRNNFISWEGSFVWLLCVNEEDGLEFRLLQMNDGKRELQVFWHDTEIKDISNLDLLLKEENLWDVFNLRAIIIFQERIKAQLALFEKSGSQISEELSENEINSDTRRNALRLRDLEQKLMQQAYEFFEQQVILKEKRIESLHY